MGIITAEDVIAAAKKEDLANITASIPVYVFPPRKAGRPSIIVEGDEEESTAATYVFKKRP